MKKLFCIITVLFFGLSAFAQTADTARKASSANGAFDGLTGPLKPTMLVDDKVFLGDINSLDVNNIKSITVLRNSGASTQYGTFNPNGVIKIETGRLYATNEPRFATAFKDTSANDTFAGLTGPLKPTILLDGKVFLGNINSLDVNNIKSITVDKNSGASKQYGTFSPNGVIKIETGRLYAINEPRFATVSKDTSATDTFAGLTGPLKPTILLDGKVFLGNINNLDVNNIKSITVEKNPYASKQYGAFNPNGVIKIETGKLYNTGKPAVAASPEKAASSGDPKYIIDGVLSESGLSNLNPEDILSVTILKDGKDHPEYGSSKGGFVVVVTKAGAIKKYQHNFSEFSADYKKYLDEHNNDDSALTYSLDGKLCDKGVDGITKLSDLSKEKIAKVKFAKSGTDVEITTKK